MAWTRPQAICVGLHPGKVDTALSQLFQRGVPAGRLFTAGFAAARLLDVLAGLPRGASSRCFAWDGREINP